MKDLLSEAASLIEMAMEEDDFDGILHCSYCGSNNGSNEPVEDDEIRHEDSCAGVRVVAALRARA